MRRIGMLGIAGALIATGCSSTPDETIDVPTPESDAVTTTIDAATPVTQPPVTEPAATSPAPTTTSAPTPATSTTTQPAPAATTAQAEPATTLPSAPTTSDDTAAPIGDGPVLTNPSDDGTSESPPVGSALAPAFFNNTATVVIDCSDTGAGTVTLQWEVIGTESVDIAVGSESQIYRLAQPPAGSLDVPLDCDDGSTYYVIAENPEGRTVRSTTISP